VTRIALLGAGPAGRSHAHAIACAAGVEPAGTYATLDELLGDPHAAPDAVVVATPPRRHAKLVAALAAEGIGVLCEQPLGTSLTDAADATRAASDAGIVLQVGFWRRFVPELRELHALIDDGGLGAITALACAPVPVTASPRRIRHPPAIPRDIAVGELDLIRWLAEQEFGELAPTGSPTASVVTAELSRGASATIRLADRTLEPWLEVWGTGGHERIVRAPDAEATDRALVAQLQSFARAVRGEQREGAGGDDAVLALAVAERIAQALPPAGYASGTAAR
jgi:myo-inositol 2-dehydrogenase/D-chiro-inositol 1-dehydrogenase